MFIFSLSLLAFPLSFSLLLFIQLVNKQPCLPHTHSHYILTYASKKLFHKLGNLAKNLLRIISDRKKKSLNRGFESSILSVICFLLLLISMIQFPSFSTWTIEITSHLTTTFHLLLCQFFLRRLKFQI